MSINISMFKDCCKNMPCEQKFSIILAIINVLYFIIYMFGGNWIAFFFRKTLLFTLIRIAQVSLFKIPVKE